MLALTRTYRLIGVDQLHTGTVVGKMDGSAADVLACNRALTEKMGKIKTAFPVASGGLNPLQVPALMKILGKDIIIQAGGGIHGHPLGTVAGATAMREAVDAVMNGIPLKEAELESIELSEASRKWG
jgi:ribulose-bisphosphate carboxylase large chain